MSYFPDFELYSEKTLTVSEMIELNKLLKQRLVIRTISQCPVTDTAYGCIYNRVLELSGGFYTIINDEKVQIIEKPYDFKQ